MEMVLLLIVLLVAGVWTKYTNGLYMRKLAAQDFLKYGKPVPTFMHKNKPIFAWWEF